MNKLFSVLALALFSTSAMAGKISLSGNDFEKLPDCKGHVSTSFVNNGSQVSLDFDQVTQCSIFTFISANGESIRNDSEKKLVGGNNPRSGNFTIPKSLIQSGDNTIVAKLESGTGKTFDILVIQFEVRNSGGNNGGVRPGNPSNGGTKSYVTMGPRDAAALNSCGGLLKTTVSGNGNGRQLNLVFSGVKFCSNFDILKANGDRVDYDMQKLDGQNPNNYGSRTLPSRFIDWGSNSVVFVLKSNNGNTSETIRVNFNAY